MSLEIAQRKLTPFHDVFGFSFQFHTPKRKNVDHAIDAAFKLFEETYPELAESLFDKSFLKKEAASLFSDDSLPTPMQLATAWRNQVGAGSAAQKRNDIMKILPAVADFLDIVDLELIWTWTPIKHRTI